LARLAMEHKATQKEQPEVCLAVPRGHLSLCKVHIVAFSRLIKGPYLLSPTSERERGPSSLRAEGAPIGMKRDGSRTTPGKRISAS